ARWITPVRRLPGREAARALFGISTGHSVCGACAVFLAVFSWHCSLHHCGSCSAADPCGHLTPGSSPLTPHVPALVGLARVGHHEPGLGARLEPVSLARRPAVPHLHAAVGGLHPGDERTCLSAYRPLHDAGSAPVLSLAVSAQRCLLVVL